MNDQAKGSTAKLQVGLMIGIIAATILLGFYMLPSTNEERDKLLGELGTTNHGTLLMPAKPIAGLELIEEGKPWRWEEHKPKWRLLLPANSRCEGECAELLYTTRQVHIRLGKYTHRVERLLLTTDGELSQELRDLIAEQHPYLKVLHADPEQLTAMLADTNSPWVPGVGKVIVVDPSGLAMMTYNTSHAGNDILEDLNHLLKYSPE